MATVPVFAPDGSLGDIPAEHLVAAVKAGAKPGVTFKAPDGSMGVIPADRIQDAYKAGGKLVPIDQQETDHHGFWNQVVDAFKSGASAYGVEDGKLPLSGQEGEALAQRTSEQAAKSIPLVLGGGLKKVQGAPAQPQVATPQPQTAQAQTVQPQTSPNFQLPELKQPAPLRGGPLKASDFAIQRPSPQATRPAPQYTQFPPDEPTSRFQPPTPAKPDPRADLLEDQGIQQDMRNYLDKQGREVNKFVPVGRSKGDMAADFNEAKLKATAPSGKIPAATPADADLQKILQESLDLVRKAKGR
jgi:hypothetical protein